MSVRDELTYKLKFRCHFGRWVRVVRSKRWFIPPCFQLLFSLSAVFLSSIFLLISETKSAMFSDLYSVLIHPTGNKKQGKARKSRKHTDV